MSAVNRAASAQHTGRARNQKLSDGPFEQPETNRAATALQAALSQ